MGTTIEKDKWDDEYSVIGEKGQIGFIDYKDNKSVSDHDFNEYPVVISAPFPLVNGMPQSILVGNTSKCAIIIENTTTDPVELWGVNIFCSNPADSFTLSLIEPPSSKSDVELSLGFLEAFSIEDRVLQPYQTLTIWLSCKPKEIGMHTSILYFDVGDTRVERVVFLLAEDKISQSLSACMPSARFSRRKQFAADESLSFPRPSRMQKQGNRHKLPEFEIPQDVRVLLENKQLPGVLSKGLTRESYAMYFRTLLIMEELHLEKEIRCYDMEGVTLRRKRIRLLALEVPGLAEKRPSLAHGDSCFAKLVAGSANEGNYWEGSIYRVEADEVLLRFPMELYTSHKNGNLYNIWFAYNRVNMRRLYQAVQAAGCLEPSFLFPYQSTNRSFIEATPFVPFTSKINEEQKHSVEMILSCSGAPPYVIYGPPGTGKTMTVVEAILQLYTTRKNTRILVCAASNSAADHILEKLTKNSVTRIKENEVFRLNATSRPFEDLQQDYIHFCYFEDCIFKCPPLKALCRYRIIISTYMSSSLLYSEGVTRGHFSHIFLDEAGQVSEPESMVPISNLLQRETVVVFAGDPKQLGPVVHSKDAENFGLGKSFLERLFEYRCFYNEDEGFVTKLVRNYRCHPAILDLPSKVFYKGELLACKENKCSAYSALDFLPNKEFPILFVGIQGCDEREGNNPSWFNRTEVSKVFELIKKIIEGTGTNESDIGVITPYRQQVLKIKNLLEKWDLLSVKVGSVEQFQGQEREIIIVSTVRSTTIHNNFDNTYCLGFLSNPRRFNVAITRARSILIIVGNPHVICKDHYWDKLLRLCSDNNSYQGCPLPERKNCEDEESISMGNLNLSEVHARQTMGNESVVSCLWQETTHPASQKTLYCSEHVIL